MSHVALYLIPLLAFITGTLALVLWVILLWDVAMKIDPSPRLKKKSKSPIN